MGLVTLNSKDPAPSHLPSSEFQSLPGCSRRPLMNRIQRFSRREVSSPPRSPISAEMKMRPLAQSFRRTPAETQRPRQAPSASFFSRADKSSRLTPFLLHPERPSYPVPQSSPDKLPVARQPFSLRPLASF